MSESAFRIGVRSARALGAPAAVLIAGGVTLVVSYYRVPAVTGALGHIAELKRGTGYGFSFVSSLLLAGLAPWLFRMAIPSLRPARPVVELLFSLGWWGAIGMIVDAFYRLLSRSFDGLGLPFAGLIALKVCCDQLGYTVVFASPANSLSHLWKETGFDFAALRRSMGPGWYRRLVLPNLIPNWIVWFPGVTLVYAMPADLQLPMANLIGCFWSLLCIQIAANSKGRVVVEPEAIV